MYLSLSPSAVVVVVFVLDSGKLITRCLLLYLYEVIIIIVIIII